MHALGAVGAWAKRTSIWSPLASFPRRPVSLRSAISVPRIGCLYEPRLSATPKTIDFGVEWADGGRSCIDIKTVAPGWQDDDAAWDLLAGREGSVGVTASDNRPFVEAVLDRYRTGMPWRDLPERFDDGTKVHLRFSRWAKSGVWERVFQHLAADADTEYAIIDSAIVRAHQHGAGAQKSW